MWPSSLQYVWVRFSIELPVFMVRYDIYLLQLGFQPVAVVSKLVNKIGKRQLYTKGETIRETIQNTDYIK